jgi:hypothetical protein
MSTFSLADQIAELKRELALRRRVYPRWVENGKLSYPLSTHRMGAMQAAIETLERSQYDMHKHAITCWIDPAALIQIPGSSGRPPEKPPGCIEVWVPADQWPWKT